jgi:hypothetical protein
VRLGEITFEGLSKDTCSELLSTMLTWNFVNFRACTSPESYLVRATIAENQKPTSETNKQKVTLIGASNLSRSTASFSDPSLTFTSKSIAGWTPTQENIRQLSETIGQQLELGAKAFVLDLLGNIGTRYKQYDGTTSLPFKSQGKFHLGGKVVNCPVDLFKKTIDTLAPIFGALKDTPSVIIPPMLRWIFERCCDDPGHCTNFGSENYGQKLLTDFMTLRGVLIRHMVGMGVKNFKVMDSCCTTTCAPTSNTTARLDGLRAVSEKDGVHFTSEGCRNLANRCTVCIKGLLENTGKEHGHRTFFWRGFKSTVGAKLTIVKKRQGAPGRGGGGTPLWPLSSAWIPSVQTELITCTICRGVGNMATAR